MKKFILELARKHKAEVLLEFTNDPNSICRFVKSQNKILFNVDVCLSSFENLKTYYGIDFKQPHLFAEVIFELALVSNRFHDLPEETKEQYEKKHEKMRKSISEKQFTVANQTIEQFLQIMKANNLEEIERKQWAKKYKFMCKRNRTLVEQMKQRAKEIFKRANMHDYTLRFDFGAYNGQCNFESKEVVINLPSCYWSFTRSQFQDPCDFVELVVAHELGHALDKKRGTLVETNLDELHAHLENGAHDTALTLYEQHMANYYTNELHAWHLFYLFIQNDLDKEVVFFEIKDSLKRSRISLEKDKEQFINIHMPNILRASHSIP